MSLPRDSSGNVTRRQVPVATVKSIGNVSLIGADVVDLSKLTVNNESVNISLKSVNALITSTTVAPNKAVMVDANRNITSAGAITVAELYVGNKKVTGTASASSSASNSPVMNQIQPGVAAPGKILSANADLRVGGVNSIESDTLVVNDTQIAIPTSTYTYSLETNHFNGMKFDSIISYNPPYAAKGEGSSWNIVFVAYDSYSGYPSASSWGSVYWLSDVGNFICCYPRSLYGYQATTSGSTARYSSTFVFSIYTNPTNMTTGIITVPESHAPYNPSSCKFIPELNSYVFAQYTRSIGRSVINYHTTSTTGTWTIRYGSTPNSLTSVVVATSSNVIFGEFHNPNIAYHAPTGKLLLLVHDSLSQSRVMQSVDGGATWSTLYTTTYFPGVLCADSRGIYLIPRGTLTVRKFSPDGVTWTDTTGAPTTSGQCVVSLGNTHFFYNEGGNPSYTSDFITFTPLSVKGGTPSVYPAKGIVVFNYFNGCSIFDVTTSTLKTYNGLNYLAGNFYAEGISNRGLMKLTEVTVNPAKQITRKLLDLDGEQLLQFEGHHAAGLWDFIWVSHPTLGDGYLCLGILNITYKNDAQVLPYIYFSKDLQKFTILAKAPIAASCIVYNPVLDTIVIYSTNDLPGNARYTSNLGKTWEISTTLFGLSNSAVMCKVVFNKLFQQWCISTTGGNYVRCGTMLGPFTNIYTWRPFSSTVMVGFENDMVCLYGGGFSNASVFDHLKGDYINTYASYYDNSLGANRGTKSYDPSSLEKAYYTGWGGIPPATAITQKAVLAIGNTTASQADAAPFTILAAGYIEPLDMVVGIHSTTGTATASLCYSHKGGNWCTVPFSRLAIDATTSLTTIRFNPIDGYVYVLGKYNCFRSKHSLYKWNQPIAAPINRRLHNAEISTPTGYEISSFDQLSSNTFSSVAYGQKTYIACSNGVFSITSNKGLTFTTTTVSGNWTDIAYSVVGNRWVSVGTNSIAFSINAGTTFSPTTLTGDWKSIEYSLSLNLFLLAGNGCVARTVDGITTSSVTLPGDWKHVRFVNNQWVLVGNGSVATSADGITFQTYTIPGNWLDIEFTANLWWLVGDNGTLRGPKLTSLVNVDSTPVKALLSVPKTGQLFVATTSGIYSWVLSSIHGMFKVLIPNTISFSSGVARLLWAYRLHSIIACGAGMYMSNHLDAGIDNSFVSYNTNTLKASTDLTYSRLDIGGSGTTANQIVLRVNTTAGNSQLRMVNSVDSSTATVACLDAVDMAITANRVNLDSKKINIQGSRVQCSASDLNKIAAAANTRGSGVGILTNSSGQASVGELRTNGVAIGGKLYGSSLSMSASEQPATGNAVLYNPATKLDVLCNHLETPTLDLALPTVASGGLYKLSLAVPELYAGCSAVDIRWVSEWGLFVAITDNSRQPASASSNNSITSGFSNMIIFSKDGANWFAKQTCLSIRPFALLHATELASSDNVSSGLFILAVEDQSTWYAYYMPDADTIIRSPWHVGAFTGAGTLTDALADTFTCLTPTTPAMTGTLTTSNPRVIYSTGTAQQIQYVIGSQYASTTDTSGRMTLTWLKTFLYNSRLGFAISTTGLFTVDMLGASGSLMTTTFTPSDAAACINSTLFAGGYTIVCCGANGKIGYTFLNTTTRVLSAVTELTIAGTTTLSGIAYNKTTRRFCASGGLTEIYVSDVDSVTTWTKVNLPGTWTGHPYNILRIVRSVESKGFMIALRPLVSGYNLYLSHAHFMIRVDENNNVTVPVGSHSFCAGQSICIDDRALIVSYKDSSSYVAGGSIIIETKDGHTYTTNSLRSRGACAGIAYDNASTVVVVTGLNYIYTSKDKALTWTEINLANGMNSVVWCSGMNMFVGVMSTANNTVGNIYTSSDGLTWTSTRLVNETGIVNSIALGAVAYSPSLNKVVIMPLVGTTSMLGHYVGSWDSASSSIVWTFIPTSGELSLRYRNPNATSSLGLFWSYASNAFLCYMGPRTTSEAFWFISYDGVSWTYFNGWMTPSGATIVPAERYALSYVPGIGELFSTSSGIQAIKSDGSVDTIIPYSSAITVDLCVYIAATNKLIAYKLGGALGNNIAAYPSLVIDLSEANGFSNDYILDKSISLIAPNTISSNFLSFKQRIPFGGAISKIHWLPERQQFFTFRTGAMASNSHFACSPTLFDWVFLTDVVAITPANAVINDMVFIPNSNMVAFSSSTANNIVLCNNTTTASGIISSAVTFASRKMWFNPKSSNVWCQNATTPSQFTYLNTYANSNTVTSTAATISTISFNVSSFIWDQSRDYIFAFPLSGSGAAVQIGDDWSSLTLPVSGSWVASSYSPVLGKVIVVASSGEVLLSNGSSASSFTQITMPVVGSWIDVIWVDDYAAWFVCDSAVTTNPLWCSTNGVDWVPACTLGTAAGCTGVTYCPVYNSVVCTSGSGFFYSAPTLRRSGTAVRSMAAANLHVNQYGGLNLTDRKVVPSSIPEGAQLVLGVDSTYKPTTTTWTVTSDERLKTNIEPADLDRCMDIVREIPLKYYKWLDSYLADHSISDKHKLGWIAQDVQSVFPKSTPMGDDGMLRLNSDQLIASMYGAIQNMSARVKKLKQAKQV